MKSELHVEKTGEDTQAYGSSDFFRLYEVNGYKYTKVAEVEIFHSKDDCAVYTYIDGQQSDLSFRDYISDLSKKYTVILDDEAQDILGPHDAAYYENGSLKSERWLEHGQLHREDGPAVIIYHEDGTVGSEKWYKNGELHREDGPAEIHYNEDNSVWREYWYVNGDLHRLDGPAEIYYDENGKIEVEAYSYQGEELSESDFNKVLKSLNIDEISASEKSPDKSKYKGPSL